MGLRLDYKEDDVIIHEKKDSRYIYLILEGDVALYSDYGTPNEYLYGILGRGKTFGEIGLLTNEPNLYTVVAITNVKVVVFSEHELESFVRGYPDQALGIMRSVTKMNRILLANLKMVMEENKDHEKYRELYYHAIKKTVRDDEEEDLRELLLGVRPHG